MSKNSSTRMASEQQSQPSRAKSPENVSTTKYDLFDKVLQKWEEDIDVDDSKALKVVDDEGDKVHVVKGASFRLKLQVSKNSF